MNNPHRGTLENCSNHVLSFKLNFGKIGWYNEAKFRFINLSVLILFVEDAVSFTSSMYLWDEINTSKMNMENLLLICKITVMDMDVVNLVQYLDLECSGESICRIIRY